MVFDLLGRVAGRLQVVVLALASPGVPLGAQVPLLDLSQDQPIGSRVVVGLLLEYGTAREPRLFGRKAAGGDGAANGRPLTKGLLHLEGGPGPHSVDSGQPHGRTPAEAGEEERGRGHHRAPPGPLAVPLVGEEGVGVADSVGEVAYRVRCWRSGLKASVIPRGMPRRWRNGSRASSVILGNCFCSTNGASRAPRVSHAGQGPLYGQARP